MGFRRPHISHGAGRELLRTQKSPLSFDSGLTNTPGSDFTPCSWGPTPTSGGSTRSARSPRPQALSPAQFPTQSALHRSRLRRSRGGPRRWSDVGRAKPRGELLRTQKSPLSFDSGLTNTPGSDLLSHAVSHAVPSAVAGLTSVFGMGTGVTLLL